MLIKIKILKEGKKFLIRCDRYHINTYGDSLKEALSNLHEALLISVGKDELKTISSEGLMSVFNSTVGFCEGKKKIAQVNRV